MPHQRECGCLRGESCQECDAKVLELIRAQREERGGEGGGAVSNTAEPCRRCGEWICSGCALPTMTGFEQFEVAGIPLSFKRMPPQKPGRSKQDYQTPPALLRAVAQRLGIHDFDYDLAASPENAVTHHYFTEADDALAQSWKQGSGWNWLNPPFAQIRPWVQKAYEEAKLGARTCMLVPAGVGSNWWRDWVHHKAKVLLLNGRLQFVGAEGLYPKDCCLLLYENKPLAWAESWYEVWTWER